jgi:hypothetical protein
MKGATNLKEAEKVTDHCDKLIFCQLSPLSSVEVSDWTFGLTILQVVTTPEGRLSNAVPHYMFASPASSKLVMLSRLLLFVVLPRKDQK